MRRTQATSQKPRTVGNPRNGRKEKVAVSSRGVLGGETVFAAREQKRGKKDSMSY